MHNPGEEAFMKEHAGHRVANDTLRAHAAGIVQ